ncbi:S-adenosyl-L-methionine-dependent methyltransferase superfamily protein [Abeliophyllum distichum]|uniref:S-adenosyl-L-methionine-dependent methyltransferase superfamily protein n=1 Tax=Abeliophyllum distichum TaxID=126358 RepID=A0ABD1VCE9_9LAMI
MADLFIEQAKQYSEGRPSYPEELFQFLASKTPNHDLVWDVGTGSGQAAASLAKIYKNVVGTDTSQKQLEFAPKLPNVRYVCTPPKMSISELEHTIAPQCSVDLVTIATAMHYFDLPTFYQQVKWILKKPSGVIAAWCYTAPEVDPRVDSVFGSLYYVDSRPYWKQGKDLVDLKYETIDFPFEPVDGVDHNGPFEFKAEKLMDLDGYFTYIRSWSAYHVAKGKGVELLTDSVLEDFEVAWNADGKSQKIVTFPIYLRIGKVGLSN